MSSIEEYLVYSKLCLLLGNNESWLREPSYYFDSATTRNYSNEGSYTNWKHRQVQVEIQGYIQTREGPKMSPVISGANVMLLWLLWLLWLFFVTLLRLFFGGAHRR